ncbi:hypothetical protein B0H66DRAFT_482827 [Apodospora peruviana]|uniref:CENP-V/GFA domain-containing protein n=1 Tax=Apodospora peruviana TaxID=516989 RepID=A0AAE0HUZ2_9PEZI|nr:hypothetical protein B0H66DRAFT_482827 [Apodospora peruviana]
MSLHRPLRGGCHCGRNRYIIQPPPNASQLARVLFGSQRSHCISQASPLAAFLRVPLQWYYSTTFALHDDETSAMIHRVYTPRDEAHTMRHFCGFCGTPLSYWSEEPRSEADFIHLTLGSLVQEDLADLEDLGLVPGLDDEASQASRPDTPPSEDTDMANANTGHGNGGVTKGRVGAVPWFDTLTEGSRLGTLRLARSSGSSRDGIVKVEWEVIEWSSEEDDEGLQASPSKNNSSKRKLDQRDSSSNDPAAMEL